MLDGTQILRVELVCVAYMKLLGLCSLGHVRDALQQHGTFLFHDMGCEHLEELYEVVDGQ